MSNDHAGRPRPWMAEIRQCGRDELSTLDLAIESKRSGRSLDMIDDLIAKARLLRGLHDRSTVVLPNAWDAASAALFAAAGAVAIATTSGGISWAHGRPDGQGLTRVESVEAARRIVEAVDVPVSADIEEGYGTAPGDVSTTVRAIIDVGVAGMNLEDSRAAGGPLFGRTEQADRLRAAREAADAAGVPELFVNARTDVFLFQIGDPAGRLDEVLDRAESYATAGADLLFVPGLSDLRTIELLVSSAPLPINVLAGPGGPTTAELRAVGARRITVGTGIAQSAYATARQAASELLESGTYTELDSAIEFSELNDLFPRRS